MTFGRMQSRDDSPPMSEINVTPMVDVMLVLLVIFLLTAPLMMTGIPLDLPSVRDGVGVQVPHQIKVFMDKHGSIRVQDQPYSLAQLPTALKTQASLNPDGSVLLHVDRAVSYGEVMAVVDTARQVGLTRVVFLTQSASSDQK